MKPHTPPVEAEVGAPEDTSGPATSPSALRRLILLAVAAGSLLGTLGVELLRPGKASASRNNAGVYSLPAGNPVSTGTTITSSWANTTLGDLGTEITNSLDRAGRSAMTAALPLSAGTVSAPGLTFSGETNSGLYKAASHDVRMSVNGADVVKWTPTGVTVTPALTLLAGASVTGDTTFAAASRLGLGSLLSGDVNASAGYSFTINDPSGQPLVHMCDGAGGAGNKCGRLIYDPGVSLSKPGWQFQNVGDTGAFVSGGPTLYRDGSLTIGASGTMITASYAGNLSWTPGSIAAQTCVNSGSLTLTGVSAGGVCNVSTDTGISQYVIFSCQATTNAVVIGACNVDPVANHSGATTYHVRVWQP